MATAAVSTVDEVRGAESGALERSTAPGHFCYASFEEYEADQLLQGDILKRTPELEAILEAVHPHFYRHNKNLFFMVLTQSCDLVRRGGEWPNALYINVAPVRPLDEVISREVASLQLSDVNGSIPLITQKSRAKLSDFVRRLLNNNVSQYFYLEGAATPLGQDCCSFLRLSIPIKTQLHYDICLQAKILQLTDAFQAKLGSLIGQLFSRVGTRDWEPTALEEKVRMVLKGVAHWVEDDKVKHLKGEFLVRSKMNPAYVLDAQEISAILRSVPSTKKLVIDRVLEIAVSSLELDENAKQRMLGRLKADPVLNGLLR